jgi:hypothetical protein
MPDIVQSPSSILAGQEAGKTVWVFVVVLR